jgi:hypothetical protein
LGVRLTIGAGAFSEEYCIFWDVMSWGPEEHIASIFWEEEGLITIRNS